MSKMKIAVIGSGSTYTPELIEGLILRRDSLPMDELCLMDIDREKLMIVGALCKRMIEKAKLDCKVVFTENLDEALRGASFVNAQVRVGRLPARILDEKIPLKYNLIGQETTGIGGFFNALRTVPVIMNVAKRMEELCPDAWLINFSNPAGIVAEAVLNFGNIKMMGLCNAPMSMMRNTEKALAELNVNDPEITYVGLNHLSYITSIMKDGKDYLQEALKQGADGGLMANIPKGGVDVECFKAIGAIPSSYLHYFYFRNHKLEQAKEAEKSRGEICVEIEHDLLEMYKNPDLNEKPDLLNRRGGHLYSEAAISLIDAIYNDKKEEHVVNIKNNGALSFMDDNDVAEIKAVIDKNGATPVKIEHFSNTHVKGMMSSMKAYEKLTVSAALNGSDSDALAALLTNPLIGDYDAAKACYFEMKEAHKQYLPQFFKN